MPDPRRDFAKDVVSRLRSAGFRALWAGGCVRDLILGLEPSDFDVATDARPEQVIGLFRRTVPVGVSFGVVRVLGPSAAGEVEVATFRSDGAYVDGRHPESITFGSPELDAARRDFTINGMFLDPLNGEVLDFVGGRDDLRDGVIRAIGDQEARFREDKLRLMRAVRFAARFGFTIEAKTRAAIVAMASQARVVAAERIAQELRKMLVDPSRAAGMSLLTDTGLTAAILPPLIPLKDLAPEAPAGTEDTLWDHTLRVLDRLPTSPSFPLAFAALVHEVGRPATRRVDDGGESYPDFESIGREIADALGRELKFANAERERVGWLVGSHRLLREPKAMRESELKRILASPGIEELLALHRADALASTGDASAIDYCEWYLREQPHGPIDPPPFLNGNDLKQLGLNPGPRFASLLSDLRDAQLGREIQSKEEAVRWITRAIDNHK